VSLTFDYDGSEITHGIAYDGVTLPTAAEQGEASFGAVPVQDPDGTFSVIGHRPFTVEESACSQPRLWTGWTTQRDYARSVERGLVGAEDPRLVDLSLVDLNALFGFRIIHGADGNRPDETWSERLTWLLGSDYLDGLIEDTGYVATVNQAMDAADYRGSYAASVMQDLSDRLGGLYNWFAFWDSTASAVGLYFDHADTGLGESDLAISNVIADIDATTFYPDTVSALAREPDDVYSEVIVTYANGTVYRRRPSTETTYIQRGTSISRPYTGRATTAQTQAEAWLTKHAAETDRITTTILVPASAAGLVIAGQRINVKFTHMPGYETWTSMRVLRMSVAPVYDPDSGMSYSLGLELVAPIPTVVTQPCPDPMETQEIPPNLSATSTSTGLVIYWSNNVDAPAEPTPNFVGQWNFPVYNIGGVDRAGDCVENRCRVFGIGEGTLEIRTAHTDVADRPIMLSLRHSGATVEGDTDSVQYGASGDTFVFTVSSQDGHCVHWVDLEDDADHAICGGNWAFAGATWTADLPDTEEPVPGPVHPRTTISTIDPTVNDDDAHGFAVGDHWVNTTSGSEWVLADATTGAAVWTLTTSTGAPATADYLVGTAQAGLSAEIVVGTTPGGELGGTWASPTVDVTHSGSAHLALGSTSSTAAAGDHTHSAYVGQLLMQDGVTSPPVPIENEAGDDWLYAD
jgi:hypothetical protein